MLVKDQLRVRMDQLGISVTELAKRLEVSNQSVRHWLTGRSFPGKRHVPQLERELSFKLDFSEGNTPHVTPTVDATLQQTDIELFIKISKLPADMKLVVKDLVDTMYMRMTPEPAPAPVAARHSASRPPRTANYR